MAAIVLVLSLLTGPIAPYQVLAADGLSENLIVNGSFESGKDGWSNMSSPYFSIATDEKRSGANSLKASGNTGEWTGFWQNVTVKPNTNYRLTAAAKKTRGWAMGFKAFPAAGGAGFGEVWFDSSEWKDYALDFNSGDATEISVYAIYGEAGTEGYFDDFWLVESADSVPPAEVTEAVARPANGSLTLSWKDPMDADLAKIKISRSGASDVVVNKGVQKAVVSGLTNGQAYTLKVQTMDAFGNVSAGIDVTGIPAVPAVSQTKQMILDYMASRPHQTSNRVISGQFTHYGDYSKMEEFPMWVHQKSGKWVGMVGADYNFIWGTDPKNVSYAKPNQTIKEYWDLGGLATISVHMYNPEDTTKSAWSTIDNLDALFTEGTATYANFHEQLKQIGDGLEQLKNEGVVVLWRPLHEMNEAFFWWGKLPGTRFQELWRETYRYLTVERGLDNLLWVYAPWGNPGAGTDNVLNYYPGDEYVDIVGLDVYTANLSASNVVGYDELLTLGKPFGFTEYGPGGGYQAFDWRSVINAIKNDFPQASFFHVWNGPEAIGDKGYYADALLNDEWVANREDIPAFGRTLIPTPDSVETGDGSFEAGDASWSYGTHFARSDETARTGTYSAKLSGPESPDWCNLVQRFDVARYTDYTLTFWSKGDPSIAGVKVMDSSWTNLQPQQEIHGGSDWTKQSITFNTGANSEILVSFTDGAPGTLYVDDVAIEQVPPLAARPDQLAFTGLIDGFERYANDGALQDAYTRNGGGGSILLSLDPTHKESGQYGMKYAYDMAGKGYAGAYASYVNPLDFSGSDGIQLWLRPDGSGNRLVLQFSESGGETWETSLTLAGTEAGIVRVPYGEFKHPSWWDTSVHGGDGVQNLNDIKHFALYVNRNGSASETGVLYFDAIRIYGSEVKVDNFEGYAADADVVNAYVRNGGGGSLVLGLEPSVKSQGAYSLKYAYDLNGKGYAGATKDLGDSSWTGMDGLMFWLKPDGSGHTLTVQFQEDNGELWEAYHTLSGMEARQVTIPFTEFRHPGWYSGGNGILELSSIKNYSLYVNERDTGIGTSGTLYFDDVKAYTDRKPPQEISEATVEAASGKLTIRWRDPADTDFAVVELSGDGLNEPVQIPKGTQVYTVDGLANGTEYRYLLRTVDTLGNRSEGIAVAGTPEDRVPPESPDNLHAAEVTKTSIKVEWSAAADDSGVEHYVAVLTSSDGATSREVTGAQTSAVFTNLRRATVYAISVKAVDAAGNESDAAIIEVTTRHDNGNHTGKVKG